MLDRAKQMELARTARERLESYAKRLETDSKLKAILRRFSEERRKSKSLKRA